MKLSSNFKPILFANQYMKKWQSSLLLMFFLTDFRPSDLSKTRFNKIGTNLSDEIDDLSRNNNNLIRCSAFHLFDRTFIFHYNLLYLRNVQIQR